MPDNQNEGMLEDFIKNCIATEEQDLFKHAEETVKNIPEPKFKPHHQSKAEISTWLAWQKQPGHGVYITVKDELIDTDNPLFVRLSEWLNHIYS